MKYLFSAVSNGRCAELRLVTVEALHPDLGGLYAVLNRIADDTTTTKHIIDDNCADNVIHLRKKNPSQSLQIWRAPFWDRRFRHQGWQRAGHAVFDEEIKAFDANFVRPNHALRPNFGINLYFLYCSNLILVLHVAYSYLLGARPW